MPIKKIPVFLLSVFLLQGIPLDAQPVHRTEVLLLMGSRFEITPYADSDSLCEAGIQNAIAEVKRIEEVISEWKPGSDISEVNRMAGIKPVKVSAELFGLVKRSLKVSDLTDGAFDISWAGARGIWRFDGTMTSLPGPKVIDSVKPLINYRNIILNDSMSTIYLAKKGMAIGLGAIGKGYAANRCREVMLKMGIQSGIVIAGGDLITWGSPGEGKRWPIGVADPQNPDNAIAWFEVGEMAVVTSGDYEKFVEIEGKRYCHIINPKTGYPVEGLRSVTIVCPDAELADALSTAVFVMGRERGMALVNQLKGVDCVMMDNQGVLYSSDQIVLNSGKGEMKHIIEIGK